MSDACNVATLDAYIFLNLPLRSYLTNKKCVSLYKDYFFLPLFQHFLFLSILFIFILYLSEHKTVEPTKQKPLIKRRSRRICFYALKHNVL